MLQLWLITWKHIHNKKYITHYDPHILLETYFDRVYTVARRKFLLDTYKIATFSTTLMLTFQNNCHPYLWTDQKIKYTERLGIPTKQFSVHTEYLIMTFQSYNLTGEFLGFRSRWGLRSYGMWRRVTGKLVLYRSRHLSGLEETGTHYPVTRCHIPE